MKDVLIGGSRFLTTDEIADSLLEYARVLSQYQCADTVHFPAVVDGVPSMSWLTFGPGSSLAAVSSSSTLPHRLEGAEDAAADIRRRLDTLVTSG